MFIYINKLHDDEEERRMKRKYKVLQCEYHSLVTDFVMTFCESVNQNLVTIIWNQNLSTKMDKPPLAKLTKDTHNNGKISSLALRHFTTLCLLLSWTCIDFFLLLHPKQGPVSHSFFDPEQWPSKHFELSQATIKSQFWFMTFYVIKWHLLHL